MELDNSIIESFREEAAERLAELESVLLVLEREPNNTELIAQAFRAMHTIKGSGGMFGFAELAAFTHELETVFDEVRSGRLAITHELVGLALTSKDLIRRMLAGNDDTSAEREKVVTALRAFIPPDRAERTPARQAKNRNQSAGSQAFGDGTAQSAAGPTEKTYRVVFRPDADMFRNGVNPMGIFAELAELGKSRVVAYTGGIPTLESIDPEICYLHWDIILTTSRGVDAIREAFVFVEDRSQIVVDLIDDGESQVDGSDYKRLGAILIERGEITTEQLKSILNNQKRVGELLVEKGLASQEVVDAAILEQQVVREARARRDAGHVEPATSVRVSAEKLDYLVDLVSELVIAQARLGQLAAHRSEDMELLSVAESMDRLSSELRDSTLKIRMVPIGTTFARFKRLVRDLSAELGKEIELVTEGAETELDKTVIERLGDPLVHLIRNSCDHGIETPDVRGAAGKPTSGTVRLRAFHTGPNVFVEIQDDGAGLDVARIRQKAIERELIAPDARLSDAEIMKLIFLPGFSTAQTVSNVSGRGVGMDVVKRSIDALRGTVELDSVPGQATTIRLRLPLTLAIIEGLLVHVGGSHYVIPMSLVEECVELTQSETDRGRDKQMAAVRGELVPYLRLRDWFAVHGERPSIEQIVIASADGFRFGFVVDGVIGQHQTVIKTLGRLYQDVQGLSGATILGDGTVALIVDVPALMRSAGAAIALAS